MKKRIIIFSVVLISAALAANLWLRSIYIVPIITYHSINSVVKKGYDLLAVAPENFNRQMKFLKNNKYNVIYLSELADILNSKKKIPQKTICITFDDGYQDNYDSAYPVLKQLNLPATIFVISDVLGSPGYLTADEITEMSRSGIDIGSHTRSHFWLGAGSRSAENTRDQIGGSKKALEEICHKKVDFFCYPGGGFTKETRQMAIDAGYKGAVATSPGRKYPKNDVYALKRLRISKNCNNLFIFWLETTGYYTWFREFAHHHKKITYETHTGS